MSTSKMPYACFLMLAVLTTQTWACMRRGPQDKKPVGDGNSVPSLPTSSSGVSVNACGVCGQPISVTIIASNQIQEPFFEIQTAVKGHPQRELLHQLEVAATQDRRFRFVAEHFGSMGYMINAINGLSASTQNKTYWRTSSHIHVDGLALGISSYIPNDMEIIMFNFTSYATPDNH
ncbi:gastric intrinsic factor [Plakobranchus ocellatus]|uniref:Gastric intrinsic factor n=1 Tax=Plakobranchus ocellatus TaxID=259542 RepID=A0AAV3YBW1_9GAST|nr:gastric intrinsic factor [Plakobranchus ocellatus]